MASEFFKCKKIAIAAEEGNYEAAEEFKNAQRWCHDYSVRQALLEKAVASRAYDETVLKVEVGTYHGALRALAVELRLYLSLETVEEEESTKAGLSVAKHAP